MDERLTYTPRTATEWRNAYRGIVKQKMRRARYYIDTRPEETPKRIRQPLLLSEWLAASPEEREQTAYENIRAEAYAVVNDAAEAPMTKAELTRRVLRAPEHKRGELFDHLVQRYTLVEDAE